MENEKNIKNNPNGNMISNILGLNNIEFITFSMIAYDGNVGKHCHIYENDNEKESFKNHITRYYKEKINKNCSNEDAENFYNDSEYEMFYIVIKGKEDKIRKGIYFYDENIIFITCLSLDKNDNYTLVNDDIIIKTK